MTHMSSFDEEHRSAVHFELDLTMELFRLCRVEKFEN